MSEATTETAAHRYDFAAVEARWQSCWAQQNTFATPNPGDAGFDAAKPKFYVLDMFPYPSGVGLHVGHPLGYIATDIVARYKRMTGHNVLHPMGFDAFGLPAEQFAVEHGVHPAITTQQNIDNMVAQLKRIGLSYDWDRCISTTDVGYYKWTQWIFLQLYHSAVDPDDGKAKPIDALRGRYTDEQLESMRLAYIAEVPVNWCPALGTVLANEEVTNDGRSERGNHPVYKRPLKQWMLRITAMADRLADDLDGVDWPEPVKNMQRNWVGRSEGASVDFPLAPGSAGGDPRAEPGANGETITVFTTRPDTLFGATYMVLAPEHELVDAITTDAQRDAVAGYVRQAAAKTDVDRMADAKTKTGVFTGAYAINPVNGEKVPVWIADYVMMGYGTGAIMAVPGHDERDHAFARAFDLPIVQVVRRAGSSTSPAGAADGPARIEDAAFTDPGVSVNSANDEVSLDGLPTAEAKRVITDWLASKGLGQAQVQYKLRDWLFSRQRYWGEPFPILHDSQTGEIVAVDAADLPVELPEMEDFSPEASDDPQAPPRPPLARAPESWRIVERGGRKFERELNTMPQWAGSCWYYLRFLNPANGEAFVDPTVERYWMTPPEAKEIRNSKFEIRNSPRGGVDLYVGGVEHAVLHLLYARFWHKVLFDLGHVSTPEPFGRLFNQGYIQAYCYRDERGIAVPAAEVVNADGKPAAEVQGQPGETFTYHGQPVTEEYGKMGKSLKNAVSPDEVCHEYGCDTLRLYEMYLGPLDQSKPWATRDIVGVHRFLQRVWRNFVDEQTGELKVTGDPPTDEMLRLTHRTIARVTDDMERMSYNTAIAALIEMNNALVKEAALPRAVAEPFVLMLAPMAPHMAEELWHRMGHDRTLAYEPWPRFEERYLKDESVEIVVQVLGKVRGKVTVPADADQKQIEQAALADERIASLIAGKQVRKVIVVPGKLVNIVAN